MARAGDIDLLDFLKRYASSNTLRFHMPGHKGKQENMGFSSYLPGIDITEIDGSDNLHKPQGQIRDSQIRASKLFGSKETLYLVNGSTSGVYTAIMGVLKPGEKALVQRNSHKSVYNGAMLGGIELEYLYPEYSDTLGLTLGVCPDEVEKKLSSDRAIGAVFITSPTYYGIVADLERIAEITHSYGAVLIVDEAHGSHLSFAEDLPPSAVQSGADIVIQSTHKTLLGYTQSAMLHICTDTIDVDRIKEMATVHQSTSPSYVLLASLDNAVSYFETRGRDDFKIYLRYLREFREEISNLDGVTLLDKTRVDGFYYDETRLVFSLEGLGGVELEERLRKKSIELEMSDESYGVAISTVADSQEDLRALFLALEEISDDIGPLASQNMRGHKYSRPPTPNRILNIRDAFYMDKEKVDLIDSAGRVSGNLVTPYPPGIPILVPGEEISPEMIDYIERLIREDINIIGIDARDIEIVRGEG